MESIDFSKKSVKGISINPGVYLFEDTKGQVIYVGKAKSLKSRVTSYLSSGITGKTINMVSTASKVQLIEVGSEIEALLLEANLVKKHRPKYNVELKDDKSPLYIGITADKYPRIITLRQTQIQVYDLTYIYGPYVNTGSVRRVLKYLRRAIPFCTHRLTKRACLYSEIGLCNPCPSAIEIEHNEAQKVKLRKKYIGNIRKIRKILDGEIRGVMRTLNSEMGKATKLEDYEYAAELLTQVKSLELMTTQHTPAEAFVNDPNLVSEIRSKELTELYELLRDKLNLEVLINRIECYDVSHFAGAHPTASMVTFINGEPDKTYYRHFKIRIKKGNSDFDSMKSVLERRAKHFSDWGESDLIIVDGGKPQVKAALDVFDGVIPIVGLAKQFETLVVKDFESYSELRIPRGSAKNLVQRMRDEAHRFARRYHHKLVKKALLEA